MKFNAELKLKAETLADQLLFINSKSITPGDPKDRDPVFVYTSGGFYRQTLEQSAALLAELAAVMEV